MTRIERLLDMIKAFFCPASRRVIVSYADHLDQQGNPCPGYFWIGFPNIDEHFKTPAGQVRFYERLATGSNQLDGAGHQIFGRLRYLERRTARPIELSEVWLGGLAFPYLGNMFRFHVAPSEQPAALRAAQDCFRHQFPGRVQFKRVPPMK